MKILFFGITRDIVGETMVDARDLKEIGTVGELRDLLNAKYPRLKDLSSLNFAINEELAEDFEAISVNDEIALIPPVSGG
ncbi:MoaD/ThiS family protein [Christiangramia crocea]|uniref:Molybdopterin synthase sulfur carrier subunit n=1 Tax=Christiangramia crocea TaxID=2904124 RepID=A0A9X1UWX6_9FLAO|nr:MoaD/ThiS family protein [Gramella crocea]MCG9971877.1 MoaD/ThiS family protein [Gramella crocea]